MPVHARYTSVWVDEFDFSGESMGADMTITSPTIETTTFQATGKVFQVTGAEGGLAHRGYVMALGPGTLEEEMYARLGAGAHHVAALYGTNAAACPAYVLPATAARAFAVQAPVNGVLTVVGEWGPGSGIRRGLRVLDAAITATGVQAGVDFGAPGGAGGNAWLFVRSITGAAVNATVTVQAAADAVFTTPATKATFTFSAVGGYAQPMSGAVGRYIRANVTALGGSTGFTIGLIVAVNGVTQ